MPRKTHHDISGLSPAGLANLRRTLRDPITAREVTYDAVAKLLGISKGALWKFLNTDYVPGVPLEKIKSSNRIRHALGLPEMIISFRHRNDLGQFQ